MKYKIDTVLAGTFGQWDECGMFGKPMWTVNYSHILSILIKAAAMHCDSYASDLFISWESFMEKLKNPDYEGGLEVFGFRDMGVDHKAFVDVRLGDPATYGARPYKELYVLETTVEGDIMHMRLGTQTLL